jgi:hypothetical protein
MGVAELLDGVAAVRGTCLTSSCGCLAGKEEAIRLWPQNHFTLIPRSLAFLRMPGGPHSGSKVSKALVMNSVTNS